ncbi:hypothetical protein ebA5329 [Aromatoleum aromaticum EbN1]|uniref:Uncharacterized protein n=1 Tax=Aromatoleum aromaticum (strain DSM 19018 / LMG 30748 / EbN1) TaxID=76114 RepID=Q5P0K9_AROAE|nr:hypothetical protein ebA5329 [Aromatoleum aromaticum EbN1]
MSHRSGVGSFAVLEKRLRRRRGREIRLSRWSRAARSRENAVPPQVFLSPSGGGNGKAVFCGRSERQSAPRSLRGLFAARGGSGLDRLARQVHLVAGEPDLAFQLATTHAGRTDRTLHPLTNSFQIVRTAPRTHARTLHFHIKEPRDPWSRTVHFRGPQSGSPNRAAVMPASSSSTSAPRTGVPA